MKRLSAMIKQVKAGGKFLKVTKAKVSKSHVWDKSVMGPMGGKK